MKKYWFIALLNLGLIGFAAAQHKPQPLLDVDRVWQLYKDTSDITINYDGQEIKAKVLISYNALNKPYSVIAYGEVDASVSKSLNKLMRELSAAKLQAGYKQSPGTFPVDFNPTDSSKNTVMVSYFEKGTQSAKYGVKRITNDVLTVKDYSVPLHVTDLFYFEVCDEGRRKDAKTSQTADKGKFVF